MRRRRGGCLVGKHDWTKVDWTRTNAEIAASLGIRSVESVARKRRALGMPAVYPPTPTERIQALEAERDALRAKITELEAALFDWPLAAAERVRAAEARGQARERAAVVHHLEHLAGEAVIDDAEDALTDAASEIESGIHVQEAHRA